MMKQRVFALLSQQGTACAETALYEHEYNEPSIREAVEHDFCHGGQDDPIKGSWTDVTDNEACNPNERELN